MWHCFHKPGKPQCSPYYRWSQTGFFLLLYSEELSSLQFLCQILSLPLFIMYKYTNFSLTSWSQRTKIIQSNYWSLSLDKLWGPRTRTFSLVTLSNPCNEDQCWPIQGMQSHSSRSDGLVFEWPTAWSTARDLYLWKVCHIQSDCKGSTPVACRQQNFRLYCLNCLMITNLDIKWDSCHYYILCLSKSSAD